MYVQVALLEDGEVPSSPLAITTVSSTGVFWASSFTEVQACGVRYSSALSSVTAQPPSPQDCLGYKAGLDYPWDTAGHTTMSEDTSAPMQVLSPWEERTGYVKKKS